MKRDRDYASEIAEAMYDIDPEFESARVKYEENRKRREKIEADKDKFNHITTAVGLILGTVGFGLGVLFTVLYVWKYYRV